jgi:8-oxo-dGTP pyrophosphatase MutT (NUDIX family)
MKNNRDIASAILYSHAGNIGLQFKDGGYQSYPLHWTSFGGLMKPGETTIEALKRELLEETGIKFNCADFFSLGSWDYSDSCGKGTMNAFAVPLKNISSLEILEGGGIGFFKKGSLNDLKKIPTAEPLIEQFYKNYDELMRVFK